MTTRLPYWRRVLPGSLLAIVVASVVMAIGSTAPAFAEIPGAEPIPPRAENPGPIVPGPSVPPSGIGTLAVTGALVNDPTLDTTVRDTQSETTAITGPGGLVVVAYNDSASIIAGDTKHFTGWSRSTDGGLTFTDMGALPDSTNGDSGDPVLARDEVTGRIFLSTLMFAGSGIQVFRSDDGAQTWIAPVNGAPGTIGFQDKEWLAVDNFAGAGQGNVYMAWTDFGAAGTPIRFTRSTDQGATFGPSPGMVISSGCQQHSFVAVAPDHSVYAFWWDCNASPQRLLVRRSTDQGLTFGSAVVVTTLNTTGTNGSLSLNGGLRSNTLPHAAVNPINGDLYVVYNDCAAAACAGADHGNVFMRRSTDSGATWSAATMVNDDATATDQFFPTVAVLPSGGQLMVSFYDRRNDIANNLAIDRYAAIGLVDSGSGAVTFQPNVRVSGQNFPVVIGQDPAVNATYMGDYDQVAADADGFHVIWGDNSLPNPSQVSHANQPDVRHQFISALASLGDYVWEDLNGDGIQDLGEPGVSGAMVELLDSGDNVVDTAVTDADGEYLFEGLWPGQYRIRVVIPPAYLPGFGFTVAGATTDDLDSDVDSLGRSPLLTLVSGENNDTVDAGIVDILPAEFLLYFDPVLGDLVVEGIDDGGALPVVMSGGGFFRTYTIEDTAGNKTAVNLVALKFGFGRVFFWLQSINYNSAGEQPIYGRGLFYSSGFSRTGALSNFIGQVRASHGPSYMAGYNGTTTKIYGAGGFTSLPGFVSLTIRSEEGATSTGYGLIP